jgi:NADPH:quinone reductase-like Zn-dependent oxidoreductase
MQAVICSAYGPPEVLKLADLPTPAPSAGEVRIRVRATAVTSSDCYVRGLDDAVGKRKSASALRKVGRVLAPGGRRISVDDGAPKLVRDDLELLAKLAASGSLRPVIDRIYPLEDIVEAHRYVGGGHKRGNVIVTVA